MLVRRLAWTLALAATAWGFALAAAQSTAPATKSSPADAAKRIAQGRYLVQIMGCGDCHTPGTFYGDPDTTRAFSGSEMGWRGPWGVHYAANLTPDNDTGIGYWTAAELARTLRSGIRPDGTKIGPPMPVGNYAQLTEEDAQAIAAYLMSRKPVKHEVPAPLKPGIEPKGPVLDFPPPPAWDAPRAPASPAPAAAPGEKKPPR